MPTACVVQICEDVKALVAAIVAAEGGVVERVYVPKHLLETLGTLIVSVAHRADDRNRETRKLWSADYTIDVAVQKSIATDADVDALVLFTESLADLIADTPLPTLKATPRTVKVDPTYVPEHLESQQAFTSVITAVYRLGRTPAE